MSNQCLLKSAVAVNALADLMMKCPEVIRYNEGEHNEAGAIADAFSDFEKSFHTFLKNQLPRLSKGQLEPNEIYDLLLDVGEELRHILYHINNLKFYQYLSKESS